MGDLSIEVGTGVLSTAYSVAEYALTKSLQSASSTLSTLIDSPQKLFDTCKAIGSSIEYTRYHAHQGTLTVARMADDAHSLATKVFDEFYQIGLGIHNIYEVAMQTIDRASIQLAKDTPSQMQAK